MTLIVIIVSIRLFDLCCRFAFMYIAKHIMRTAVSCTYVYSRAYSSSPSFLRPVREEAFTAAASHHFRSNHFALNRGATHTYLEQSSRLHRYFIELTAISMGARLRAPSFLLSQGETSAKWRSPCLSCQCPDSLATPSLHNGTCLGSERAPERGRGREREKNNDRQKERSRPL